MQGNVHAVRNDDGNLSVFVDGNKMIGTKNVQIVPDGAGGMTLIMGVSMILVELGELSEDVPIEKDGNVVYGAFGTTTPSDSSGPSDDH